MGMRGGDVDEFGIMNEMTHVVQKIEIAHAVNNHQEILLLVDEIIPVIDRLVPAANGPDLRVIARRQGVRCVDDRLSTFQIAGELPVLLQRGLHNEAHVMRICSLGHLVDDNGPVSAAAQQIFADRVAVPVGYIEMRGKPDGAFQ